MNSANPIETRNKAGNRSKEFQPPVAPPSPPATSPVTPVVIPSDKPSHLKAVAGLVVAGVVGVGAIAFTGQAFSPVRSILRYPTLLAETWSPAYQAHRLAKPDTPIVLTKADYDADATKAATEAARQRKPIPRLTAVTPNLLDALIKGKVQIYTIRAYDTCREDGDWITIMAPNLSKQGSFMIRHAATYVSIPVINGVGNEIVLFADKDGVGGVTVGLQSDQGMWYSQVLAEGAIQKIPVMIR